MACKTISLSYSSGLVVVGMEPMKAIVVAGHQ